MFPMNDRYREQWKMFEKLFGGKMPFLENDQIQKMMKDPQWVEKYVQSMLKRSVPQAAGFPFGGQSVDPEVFETHRSVIARIKIPKDADPYSMRVYTGKNRIKLEGLGEEPAVVPLPVSVNPQGCRARYKDGILELRMPKDDQAEHERPVQIRFDD